MSRKEARESVMCFLFQNTFIDKYDSSIEDRIDNYISFREFDSEDVDFFKAQVTGIIDQKAYLDEEISKYLVDWKVSRLPRVDLAILETAFYEMLFSDDIPTSVSISEAVRLSKKYGNEQTRNYINGVLSSFSKNIPNKE